MHMCSASVIYTQFIMDTIADSIAKDNINGGV